MAVKQVHGATVQTYDTGTHLWSLMEDGIILVQSRWQGRLEGAKVWSRKFVGKTDEAKARLVLHNGWLRVRKDHNEAVKDIVRGLHE